MELFSSLSIAFQSTSSMANKAPSTSFSRLRSKNLRQFRTLESFSLVRDAYQTASEEIRVDIKARMLILKGMVS